MAKEVRLIDADALDALEDLKYIYHPVFDGNAWYRVEDVWKCIDEQPTIDPESLRPVGRWERVHGSIHSSGYAIRCTECGKYHFVHYRGLLGGLYGHDELFTEPPGCPNCGAKMMEE